MNDPNIVESLNNINYLCQSDCIAAGLSVGVLLCVIFILSRSSSHFW